MSTKSSKKPTTLVVRNSPHRPVEGLQLPTVSGLLCYIHINQGFISVTVEKRIDLFSTSGIIFVSYQSDIKLE